MSIGRQLFIPTLNTIIILTEPWSFKLFHSHINLKLIKNLYEGKFKLGTYFSYEKIKDDPKFRVLPAIPEHELKLMDSSFYKTRELDSYYLDVTLPEKTLLVVDKIFIRKGLKALDAVTFRTGVCENKNLSKKRFWVSIDDANKIYGKVIKG